jgi:aspartyl protease family protein
LKFLPAAALGLLLPLAATAQTVSLAGQMGNKALLVIDGQTQMLAVGDSARGVRLLRLGADEAVVERDGQQSRLRVGGAPARLAGNASTAGAPREIVIPAGPGGHFVAAGAINGRAVQFMVDTGATLVSISQIDAERIGLDWRSGRPVVTQTANGPASAFPGQPDHGARRRGRTGQHQRHRRADGDADGAARQQLPVAPADAARQRRDAARTAALRSAYSGRWIGRFAAANASAAPTPSTASTNITSR